MVLDCGVRSGQKLMGPGVMAMDYKTERLTPSESWQ